MVIKQAKWLGGRGMSLWPFGIYVKRFDYADFTKLVNHEKIHWEQQKELPVVFYVLYGLEWFVNLFKYGKRAYINISFEQEAYDNDQIYNYLSYRKRFASFRYLRYKPVK